MVKLGESGGLLTGSHLQTMDDRLRLAIPAKLLAPFRKLAGAGAEDPVEVVVSITKNARVGVYPRAQFFQMIERLAEEAEYDPDAEKLLTGYVNYMDEQSLDKQNRFRVPQVLAENFGLGGEVAVLGSVTILEVVSKPTLDVQLKDVVAAAGVADAKLRIARRPRPAEN